MKHKKMLVLAAMALAGLSPIVRAQSAATGGDQGDGTNQIQAAINAFNERMNNASPDEKERLMQFKGMFEQRMQQEGIDLNGPNALQQIQQRFGGGRGGGAGGIGGMGGMAGGRGGRGGMGPGGAGANLPLTPQQKDDQRRLLMIASGISDKNTQDDIIEFLNSEEKAREPLLKLAQAAAVSMSTNIARVAALGGKSDENEQKVNQSFTIYTDALAVDKKRHDAALKSLDASTGFMTNTRLKAFLTLVGVVDNDALALGGAAAIFPKPSPMANFPAANNNQPRSAKNPEAGAVAPPDDGAAPATGGFGALPAADGNGPASQNGAGAPKGV